MFDQVQTKKKKKLEEKLKVDLPPIIKKIISGDSSAKEEFAEILLPYVELLIWRYKGSIDEIPTSLAGLLVCRFLERLDKFDLSKSVLGYICTSVNNYCIDLYRKKRSRDNRIKNSQYKPKVDYYDTLSIDTSLKDVFTEEDYNIISMFHIDNKTQKEISDLTGYPIQRVKETLDHAEAIYRDYA
jgi:RNA polymerase sigma factor (sigma-70 family)